MKILFLVMMFVLGAIMGSFACCQAWRLRLQAEQDKKKEVELGARSVCLKCGHKLKWYENVPVVSWLMLRGKCKKCGAFIGWAEILSEVAMGVIFVAIGAAEWGSLVPFSAVGMLEIIILVVLMTEFWVLAVYDAKWGEMPTAVLWASVGTAAVYAAVGFWEREFAMGFLVATGVSVVVLAGIYYILYRLSNEKLMGGGDPILCLAIALVLGDPWLALIELFVANMLASIVMLPAAVRSHKRTIHFAPFLVIGFVGVFVLRGWLGGLI